MNLPRSARPTTLLVATGNQGKLREIRGCLEGTGVEVRALADLVDPPEIVEDGATFLENARKKAWTLAEATGEPVLADDSGLVVTALGGEPGVRSARFAGEAANDGANNRYLLERMAKISESARDAAFVCCMVLAVPGRGEVTAEGRFEGRILERPRGHGGFGYDPLFWVESEGKTLAEIPLERKNAVSHRGRALALLRPVLRDLASWIP